MIRLFALLPEGPLELIMRDEYILIRIRQNETAKSEKHGDIKSRYSFIGIGHTRDPEASVNAEEILAREIKRDSGWSLD